MSEKNLQSYKKREDLSKNIHERSSVQTKSFTPPDDGINFTAQKKEIYSTQFFRDTAVQLKSMTPPNSGVNFTVQKKENNTGLPNQLKSGVEQLSGVDISDVKVHYNSSQPAQLNAHAYAQGNQIHVAPGQEKHVAHEAWHVVQQKQGRVKPTKQLKGKVDINDDKGLEKEADVMGAKALSTTSSVQLKAITEKTIQANESTIQRNPELDAVKATFNTQQGPAPAKDGLVAVINVQINSLNIPGTNLSLISTIRNEMDIVLSTFTDGLVAHGLPADSAKRLLALKRQITDARLTCESIYRQCLISSDDEQAVSIKVNAHERLRNAWAPVNADVAQVQHILQATAKTGAREERRWGSEAMGNLVTDDSIDIRSAKLAQLVQNSGFVPHLVVGLPTAGAHIAARVAGELNSFPASSSETTELMTLRPRYVKPSADAHRTQDQINHDNEGMLHSELMIKLLPLRASLSAHPVARILVVDDFSLSGGSLLLAANKIHETLIQLGYTPIVKTGVTRYTNGQLRDNLLTDAGSSPNPIDYVVGTHGSGKRKDVKDHLLDEEGHFPKEELMDQAGDWEKGWMEQGEEALHIIGIDPPQPSTGSGFRCFITTACVQHKGFPDDCEELNVLRKFRDTYLLNKDKGNELIKLYYKYSPEIVTAIKKNKECSRILDHLYSVIKQCVEAIKKGDNEFAFQMYCKMVIDLQKEFIPEIKIKNSDHIQSHLLRNRINQNN
ncbi:MAG: CFI-box-CTERM domain-containing protein [Sphingobacteriaceae bacterium]